MIYYILPDNFPDEIEKLYNLYAEKTGIDLEKASREKAQPYRISCFFGAKDINSRDKQISFLKKMLAAISPSLSKDKVFATPEAKDKHVGALRVLLAAVLYVKSSIAANYMVRSEEASVLETLLNQALALGKNNVLNEDTRKSALFSAQRFISGSDKLEEINKPLSDKLTEQEWHEFSTFITRECCKIDEKKRDSHPVASVMQPAFGAVGEITGYSAGFILGDMITKSSELLPAKVALSAAVGSTLIYFSSPMGAMLVAPIVASKLLDVFGGVSMACVMGYLMRKLGEGAGYGLGRTMESTCSLMYQAGSLIVTMVQGEQAPAQLTGFNLVTGQRIVNGLPVELHSTDIIQIDPKAMALPTTAMEVKLVEFDLTSFTLEVGGEKQTFPRKPVTTEEKKELPYLAELEKALQNAFPAPLIPEETRVGPDSHGELEQTATSLTL
ncbi:hypothetical protein [Legionella spiritensis]|uniref:hypothetical protein n=1 Tax=Legionella spiritensis TaxID=452 RepID=UPI000F6D7F83|nr:hypothetical protein [Legionella spiritensis]VEG89722.1 Dot/Icm secretion system substrate [Legionella spiritensis]